MNGNENELPPRVHCFKGPRISLDDVCRKALSCKVIGCMWKARKVPTHLGKDNNHTEAMGPQVR